MEEQEVKRPVDSGFVPHSNPLLSALKHIGDPDSLRVTVDFQCGECCKRVINAKILKATDEFLVLGSCEDSCVVVKTISDGEVIGTELVKAIAIPLDRVCCIEVGAVQV
ncbi:MAG TPA: hypothetical protein GX515_12930 [Firmicutes bacterium]|nr:hypothetical protein [Bacillota bacterium]